MPDRLSTRPRSSDLLPSCTLFGAGAAPYLTREKNLEKSHAALFARRPVAACVGALLGRAGRWVVRAAGLLRGIVLGDARAHGGESGQAISVACAVAIVCAWLLI